MRLGVGGVEHSGARGTGAGALSCVVINVTDLERAYEFWGAVTDHEWRLAAGVTT